MRVILFLCLFTISGIALALTEYEAWLQQTQDEFDSYLSEQDKAFSNFIKQDWVKKQIDQTPERDSTPKPVNIPEAPSKPIISIPEVKPVIDSKPKPPAINVSPVAPPAKKPNAPSIKVEFLGHALEIPGSQTMASFSFYSVNNKNIANGFEHLAKSTYDKTLQALQHYQSKLRLDNWAYANLVHAFARQLTRDDNKQTLINWFFLLKSNFDVRLAHDKQKLILLTASPQTLYRASYFVFSGKRYYTLRPGSTQHNHRGAVYTYKQQHDSASREFIIKPKQAPLVAGQFKIRKLKFADQVIEVQYSEPHIQLLDTYPQLDMDIYFNSGLTDITANSLFSYLKAITQGQSKAEAAQTLLTFIHSAFPYQTDQQQFQQENYLFATETLYYPYSDCEDRSALYAYLLDQILDIRSIGLLYDGHVATAIAVNGIEGDHVPFNGTQYVVADPTYINAKLGMTMPRYKNAQPTIIKYE
ncbi:hypothetical protein HF888_14940 [Bermanella marisrubri]|uniref:Transglutaminase-like domain-containing protein n=1 Tax=Bermanella marisrubri TaxID=207949 RepID=Q1N210_9GAMM|nr:hypothetical protein [Bermanella marisrubri]EAT12354.1 hypothetical protein RED65_15983 [Bermanella marisrubri]QIZ85437.1 hypothetical protein HF888_14940 [Bermanella marisrubri]